MTSIKRFSRAALPTDPIRHEPAQPASQAAPNWPAWTLDEPAGAWAHQDCPRCQAPGLPVCAHPDGLFWCAACGSHGDTKTPPNRYRGTWLSVWSTFLEDPCFSAAAPEDIPSDAGCMAPAYTAGVWATCWHSWCRSKSDIAPDDAIIFHPNGVLRYPWPRPTPLRWDAINGQRAILCADMDSYRALRAADVQDVVLLPPGLSALLPTAPEWNVLAVVEEKMNSLNNVVIATSKSFEGRQLEDELGRRLGREKCHRVRWHSPGVDPAQEEPTATEAARVYGSAALRIMVDCALPFPVAGIHELDDMSDRFEVLYRDGLTPGVSTGWPSMDEHYTVKTGQWTSLTGIPGHGKSTLLDALLVNLAAIHGWRFGVFSPENQPLERHYASLMEKFIGKPFSEGAHPRISESEKNGAKRWLNDRFKMILPDEESGVWTLDAVLALAKIMVYRYGIRGVVIDPWNELDHSSAGQMRETDHISESLTKIRRFARLYDVHVWIVAHPTKLLPGPDGKYPVPTPYNISGGAHWRNKADNCLAVYRHVGELDSDVVDIHVQKIRFKEVGRLGVFSLRSDRICGRFLDDIDQDRRAAALDKGLHVSSSSVTLPRPRGYRQGAAPVQVLSDPF